MQAAVVTVPRIEREFSLPVVMYHGNCRSGGMENCRRVKRGEARRDEAPVIQYSRILANGSVYMCIQLSTSIVKVRAFRARKE